MVITFFDKMCIQISRRTPPVKNDAYSVNRQSWRYRESIKEDFFERVKVPAKSIPIDTQSARCLIGAANTTDIDNAA